MNLFRLSLLMTASLTLCAAAHAEVVGRVLMAAGDASLIRDNQELRAAVGSPVEDKDTLKTGPFSNMQVRFTDQSVVSLRDQSLLKIDEYKFSGKQDGMEKAFFNLLKGGFRTITGLIGKVNKSNYGVKTATATIGIRGTNFALLHCAEGNCGAAAKDGLYGGVSGGVIAATNSTGEYQFGSGDFFYIPSNDKPAKKLIGPPKFFADHLAGQGHVEGQQLASIGDEHSRNGGAASDSRPNKLVQPPPQQTFIVTESLGANGGPAVIQTPVIQTPVIQTPSTPTFVFPSQGTGAIVYYPLSSNTSTGFTISGSFTNTNGQMESFSGMSAFSGVTNVGSIGGASVLDSGNDVSAGNLTWGRWFGPGATVNGQPIGLTVGNLHYAIGDMPTMPTSGTVTYNPVGGTSPTNANGFTGVFLGGSVVVNFLTASMNTNLQLGFNSATYNMNGATNYLPNGQFQGGLNGTCTGNSCSATGAPTAVTGTSAGSFTGANAPGIAMVYNVVNTVGTNGVITGAQGFKR